MGYHTLSISQFNHYFVYRHLSPTGTITTGYVYCYDKRKGKHIYIYLSTT